MDFKNVKFVVLFDESFDDYCEFGSSKAKDVVFLHNIDEVRDYILKMFKDSDWYVNKDMFLILDIDTKEEVDINNIDFSCGDWEEDEGFDCCGCCCEAAYEDYDYDYEDEYGNFVCLCVLTE